MKIVILDGYTENPGDLSWKAFEEFGELTVYDRTAYTLEKKDEIILRAKGAQAVIINKTPINAEIIDALMPELEYIGVLATGYNVVDVAYANEKGVTVCNIPTYGTAAVAQFAIALTLELCHHVGEHSGSVHRGEWQNNADWCYWNYPLIELAGKTMGIIGYGRIGQNTAKIAQALGMNILACDENKNPALENESMHYTDLDTLLKESDIISLHCPLFESTKEIIRAETIAKMKDGAMIINTSRGPLVNERDLAAALNSGKLLGAAVDVVSSEPIKADNPLLKAKNCIITPHIAWAPKESRQRLLDIAVENLRSFIKKEPINIVR